MKCVCGFDSDEIGDRIKDELDDFVRVNGHYTTKGESGWDYPREVYLYICPKCLTVRAER